jgi:hypothetical protein
MAAAWAGGNAAAKQTNPLTLGQFRLLRLTQVSSRLGGALLARPSEPAPSTL